MYKYWYPNSKCVYMKAIGWLLIMIGVGAGIDAFHGNSPYKTLVSYLQGTGAVPVGSPVPATVVGSGAAAAAAGGAALSPNAYPGLAGGMDYSTWLHQRGK